MCLIIDLKKHPSQYTSSVRKPYEVEEDMTVYKVLLRYFCCGEYRFITPYQRMRIEFYRKAYTCKPFTKEEFVTSSDFIGGNAYHAFTTNYATGIVGIVSDFEESAAYLVKCIIPKGSLVYYGQNNDICSNRLIIKEDEMERLTIRRRPDISWF